MQNKTPHWLLALGLLLLSEVNLSAQYLPSPQDNPRWVMNIWSLAQFLDKEEIWTEPDTVVLEGESWTPLIRVHHWNPNSSHAPSDPTPDTILVGYYRMEGAKVYRGVVHIQTMSGLPEDSYLVEFYASNGQLLHKSTKDIRQPVRLPDRISTTGLYQLVVRDEQGMRSGAASLLVVD